MRVIKLLLLIVFFFNYVKSYSQFNGKNKELSLSIYNNTYGLPFVQFTPIYLGGEVGITFLQRDKPITTQRIAAQLGFFNHKLIANAPYLKSTYSYQLKILRTIGIDGYAGLGYIHIFYPGEAYSFNTSQGSYEKKNLNQGFLLTNIGFGISYLKANRVSPFIKYELMMAGFDTDRLFTNFHFGISIELNKTGNE
ncbi:hypothetical protein ACJRPK_17350 [Aquimarina sp. 2-A2]|uniref:hypothetical protein n=1 Tax=Aquimarina sp. 2-A2 TaxID=3382644 RepID=UPI00387F0533